MIRLAMAGALGRMGRTILALALKDKDFRITGALEHEGRSEIGADIGPFLGVPSLGVEVSSDIETVLKRSDVLIDFTSFSATPGNLAAAKKTGTAYVLGTTALPESVLSKIKLASKKIPIVQSPNMSIGVNLLFKLSEIAAKVLDESYDMEMMEIHHRHKKDAPSGTAMKLLEVVAKARGKNIKKDVLYGREGDVGARPRGEIGSFALRGGDVVGDHTLYFFGDGERIELTHKASSREAFAKGALTAAKFIAKRKSGLYDMSQVLGMI